MRAVVAVTVMHVLLFVLHVCGRRLSVFWLRWCGWCRRRVGRGLGLGSGGVGWCYVCVSLDSLCR